MNFTSSIYHKFRYVKYGFLPTISLVGNQDVVTESPTSKSLKNSDIGNGTGWDRLYMMFSKSDNGLPSPQIVSVYQTAFAGLFIGGLYGGVVTSRNAHLDYMDKNQEKIFESPMHAKKEIQDKFTINFARGAFRWGWRLSLFTTSYVLTSTTISTYRGKYGIIEHTFGGALAGGLYKVKMGLAGTAVGVGLGAALGTLSGIITYGLLKVSGYSMDDMHDIRYKIRELRRKNLSSSSGNPSVLKMHENLVKDSQEPGLDSIK